MSHRTGLQGLAEDLVSKAHMDGYMIGSPTSYYARHKPYHLWPDRCKPGGLIKNIPKKDRDKVKELKAKHFNHRYP